MGEQTQDHIQELKEKAAAVASGTAPASDVLPDPDTDDFGSKLATSLGAGVSEDHDGKPKNPEMIEAQTRMEAAARPQDFKAKLAEMSFEEQVTETLECLGRKNNQKEILYDLLVFCTEERTEEETEAFLEAHKQFPDAYHTANKHIYFMQRTGALEEIEYDEDGQVITEQRRDESRAEGASEEEIEELAVAWSYKTTEVGRAAIEQFDPAKRTQAMLATQKESRLASYKRLLEFCETPRSLSEITTFMDGDPGLEIDSRTGVMQMQPSAYIGKLDQAGALTWEDGWKTTRGGMEVLATLDID